MINFEANADVSDILSLLAICIAIASATLSRAHHKGSSLFYLHQFAARPEFADARRAFRRTPPALRISDWSEAERQNADLICVCYDQVGLLLRTSVGKLAAADLLCSSWGQSIIDQARWVQPYLDEEGADRASFFCHFIELKRQAARMRRRGPPGSSAWREPRRRLMRRRMSQLFQKVSPRRS